MSLPQVRRRIAPVLLGRAGLIGLALVLAMTVLARLIPALMLGSEVADITTYRAMAAAVIREEDIYETRNLFPYTPLSLFLPAFLLHISTVFEQPFHLIVKQVPILSDVGTATLIYLIARRRWGVVKSTGVGLAWAFNPVSILITGFHGNIMPLSVFLAFWAYYLFEFCERRRTFVLSALALGIAIGLRGWPLVLVPFFLRPGFLDWRQRIIFLGVAAFPSAITLGPYLLVNFEGINREFFGYNSNPDFGWMGIWRNLWFLNTGNQYLPGEQGTHWLERTRYYFLAGYTVLVAVAFLKPYLLDTAGWIASSLILFYTLFGGVAAQYLVWVVPFLALYRYGFAFSVVASGALISFYLTYHSGILLGTYPSPIEYSRPEIVRWYLGFLLAMWAVGAVWVLWILTRTANAGLQYASYLRSRVLAG